MNTWISISLAVLFIGSLSLVHYADNDKITRRNYGVTGAFIFVGTVLFTTFFLIYVIFELSLILAISSVVLLLGIVLAITGDMEDIGGIGLAICGLSLFFGFLIGGLFGTISYDYEKLNVYEKCKIEDKYIYMYKDKQLITNENSDVLYLRRGINSYYIRTPDKPKLVIDKEEDYSYHVERSDKGDK